ncbi:MAG TPA: SH3 domain-containing protein [Anaerolineaceae bacterium]|nr:SH3 domain-containing protein [Anaerolineaceae bacterium]HOD43340.1 SH3 domain-containing protein [Anaerolineaceae bacterium]HOH19313.1 SH3 domain-containing protein [Anaerolineaceae bacterium]HOU42910.1 SH3 domain-containing protein [Anaerolineaceae bacterium]HQF44403.1 SH3 domain-containing protein [Anaerolineaceae bacterium]
MTRALSITFFVVLLITLAGCTPLPASPTPNIPQPTVINHPFDLTPTPQVTVLPTQPLISDLAAVIEIDPEEVLNVRQSPGLSTPILATLAYDTMGIRLTGQQSEADTIQWVQVQLADGQTGWVDRQYLTGLKSSADFCADPQLPTLLIQFKQAVATQDGALLSSIVSPWHGLQIQFFNGSTAVVFPPDQTSQLFTGTVPILWGVHPGSGLETSGTYMEIVHPTLSSTLESGGAFECNPTGFDTNYSYRWPASLQNLNHLSIYRAGPPEMELDWHYWWIGIVYVNGQPYLHSLMHFAWEP